MPKAPSSAREEYDALAAKHAECIAEIEGIGTAQKSLIAEVSKGGKLDCAAFNNLAAQAAPLRATVDALFAQMEELKPQIAEEQRQALIAEHRAQCRAAVKASGGYIKAAAELDALFEGLIETTRAFFDRREQQQAAHLLGRQLGLNTDTANHLSGYASGQHAFEGYMEQLRRLVNSGGHGLKQNVALNVNSRPSVADPIARTARWSTARLAAALDIDVPAAALDAAADAEQARAVAAFRERDALSWQRTGNLYSRSAQGPFENADDVSEDDGDTEAHEDEQ